MVPHFSGLSIAQPPGGFLAMGLPPLNVSLTNSNFIGEDEIRYNDIPIGHSKRIGTLTRQLSDGEIPSEEVLRQELKAIVDTEADTWDEVSPFFKEQVLTAVEENNFHLHQAAQGVTLSLLV